MRILITGGAGFIGSHLAHALLAEGHEIVVVDNLSGGRRSNVPAGASFERIDLTEDALGPLLERTRPEVVVHCAARASVAHSMAQPLEDYRANQLAAFRLAQACVAYPIRQLIFLSSGGAIYGDRDQPARETDRPAPANYYGVHKWAAERYFEISGLPVTSLRLANVYGPRQRADSEGGAVAIFLDRLLRDAEIVLHGGGEQTRDYLYVSDVIAAIQVAIQHRLLGIWNVGSGRETTIKAILDSLVRVVGRPARVRIVPRQAGDVARSCLDAGRLIGTGLWRPRVDLAEGLRRTVAGWEATTNAS